MQILCGDFFQLPPVNSKKLLFEAESWRKCVQLHLELQGNYRQTCRWPHHTPCM
jgi:hypothetical protein